MSVNLDRDLKSALLNTDKLYLDISTSLVLAPHPDDESLGCGGLIRLLNNQGAKTFICFVTDGGHSHPNSQSHPRKKLARIRKEEAIEASQILGVPLAHLLFLDLLDGSLSSMSETQLLDVSQQLASFIDYHNIKSLIIPYKSDAHADHVVTWELAQCSKTLVKNEIQIIEYPIWLWHHGTMADLPSTGSYDLFKVDVSSVLEDKRKAIYTHVSQTTNLINDDPNGFMLTPEMIKPFLDHFEYFFFEKKQKTKSLPLSYFDDLYRADTDPWDFKKSKYEAVKYQKSLSVLRSSYVNALEIGCSIGIFTNQLATRCSHLTATDISDIPLISAKENCIEHQNITFLKMDASKNFPTGSYDLIIISEVGYYLDKWSLTNLFENCLKNLNENGQILMVHWTSYVRDYPLSGVEVHELFENIYADEESLFLKEHFDAELYQLRLWQKSARN